MVRQSWVLGVVVSLCAACGGGDGGGTKSETGVLSQAPHCVDGGPVFQVQGTLDGVAIDDQRTQNSNVGLVNIAPASLKTPFSNLVALGPNQVGLEVTWASSLFYGQTGAMTGSSLMAPSSHARAGERLCITQGEVGFVDGGAEDGVFKFHITEARSGSDCSTPVPVDLKGCMD